MRSSAILFAILGSTLSACAAADTVDEQPVSSVIGKAVLSTAGGTEIGEAEITKADGAISIAVMVKGLEPGERAFHLHSVGLCEAPDFVSAEGHLNPMGRAHGSLNPDGQHLGDMPNIVVDETGEAALTFTFSDDPDQLAEQIFDADGTAVMIHAGPDDYQSDPAGAAGPRIACGVLTPES